MVGQKWLSYWELLVIYLFLSDVIRDFEGCGFMPDHLLDENRHAAVG